MLLFAGHSVTALFHQKPAQPQGRVRGFEPLLAVYGERTQGCRPILKAEFLRMPRIVPSLLLEEQGALRTKGNPFLRCLVPRAIAGLNRRTDLPSPRPSPSILLILTSNWVFRGHITST